MLVKLFSTPTSSTGAKRAFRSRWVCPQCIQKLTKRRRAFSTPVKGVSSSRCYSTTLDRRSSSASSHDASNQGDNILSLIQPTGIPHLGNYLGALRQWKQFQDEKSSAHSQASRKLNTLTFGLADLHSLTLRQDPATRRNNVRATYASLLAIGLDPSHCTIMVQSQIPAHSELMWLLSTIASTGYLSRMTQWKTKLNVSADSAMETLDEKSREALRLSLFSYPVLQAADILLYNTTLVPVGEDQAQHVEFTRHLARAFNSEYAGTRNGNLLRVPEALISPAKRVMSLKDPTKKMSKSDLTKDAAILVTDSEAEIRRKIRHAITDSIEGPLTYDTVERPGIANLFDILRHTNGSGQSGEEIAAEHAQKTKGELKTLVADAVVKELEGVKEKFELLVEPGNATIDEAQVRGREAATQVASEVLRKVKYAMGLI